LSARLLRVRMLAFNACLHCLYSGDGTFDLLFDDGTVEKDVPRHRLKRAPQLNLTQALPVLLSRPSTADSAGGSRPGTADSAASANSRDSAVGRARSPTRQSVDMRSSSRAQRGRGRGSRQSVSEVPRSASPTEARAGARSRERGPSPGRRCAVFVPSVAAPKLNLLHIVQAKAGRTPLLHALPSVQPC
jgi:hypothetical protein